MLLRPQRRARRRRAKARRRSNSTPFCGNQPTRTLCKFLPLLLKRGGFQGVFNKKKFKFLVMMKNDLENLILKVVDLVDELLSVWSEEQVVVGKVGGITDSYEF